MNSILHVSITLLLFKNCWLWALRTVWNKISTDSRPRQSPNWKTLCETLRTFIFAFNIETQSFCNSQGPLPPLKKKKTWLLGEFEGRRATRHQGGESGTDALSVHQVAHTCCLSCSLLPPGFLIPRGRGEEVGHRYRWKSAVCSCNIPDSFYWLEDMSQGMISSFFLGIDWFHYWVLGLDYHSIW